MHRAIPVIAATAGGLALLANFHSSPSGVSIARAGAPATVPSTESSAPPAPTGSTPAGSGPPTTAGSRRTLDGPVVPTRYGDVQVRVVLVGSQIVDVQALKLPNDRARSVRISDEAGPLLREETLRAQSAQIDLVSGASYTSDGYAQSLQGALDAARR
ncbi:MAG: hypothetical protein JWO37_1924 [Acidimicrobiales bacterium]|nr:hypothetical protein [Acidimicrobiales bacterium]